MSGAVTSLGPGQAPFRLDRRDALAERSGDHAPNLPPFSRFHEIRIAPFRPDHSVGECVDGLGRVRDHPLLVIRRQAIAEANAQIVEQFDDIHRLMVARLGRLGPVVRSVAASRASAGADDSALPLRAYGFFVGKDVLMTVPDEPLLTLDEAYRATFHFINQYYQREPIVPFMLMLSSMTAWSEDGELRETSDPATWNDWMASVRAARASEKLPEIAPPRET